LEFFGIKTGLVKVGSDLTNVIFKAVREGGIEFFKGDILIITSKLVATCENRVIHVLNIKPSEKANLLALKSSLPPEFVEIVIKALNDVSKVIRNSKVLIMGLTYKENVADTRETPIASIVEGLKEYKVTVFGYDPLLGNRDQFDITIVNDLKEVPIVDCIVIANAHEEFKHIALSSFKQMMNANPILVDVRNVFDRGIVMGEGIRYFTL